MSIKNKINKNIRILDICKDNDIVAKEYPTGKFTHRCKCPNPDHKSGSERTDSLYIDAEANNFYCFGCGAGSGAIDFYMICNNVDFSGAISELKEKVANIGEGCGYSTKIDNFDILIEMSDVMRGALDGGRVEADKYIDLCKFVDSKLLKIDKYDLGKTIKLLNYLKNKILERS